MSFIINSLDIIANQIMESQQQQPISAQQQFINKFNTHYYHNHPSQLQPSRLLELVQQLSVIQFQKKSNTSTFLVMDQLETLLSQKIQKCKKSDKKNGILIIGAAGVGKTCFMKQYAKKHIKIPVYMNCVELASLLKQQAQQAIDILFEMANFSDDVLLYLDEIDMLFNEDYQYEQITKGKNAIIKNLNNSQNKASIIFSTNRPWKIQSNELLNHINYAIQIPLLDQAQRKQFIEKVLSEIQDFTMENKQANVAKLVTYTQNFTNSDIYCLIKSVPWERLREMIQQSNGNIEEVKNKQIVANQKHVELAMKKVKSSFEVKQIHSFTEWRKKFNKLSQK